MGSRQVTLVIGGCRSGKSSFALKAAEALNLPEHFFVATSIAEDDEMTDRVVKHRKERGPHWQTIEEPVHLGPVISRHSSDRAVLLVDCLTLWVSNLMFQLKDPDKIDACIVQLEAALASASGPVLLVSNEVGCGIVPENRLARQFRDLAGGVNQRMAQVADRVYTTIAGIDVQIKPKE